MPRRLLAALGGFAICLTACSGGGESNTTTDTSATPPDAPATTAATTPSTTPPTTQAAAPTTVVSTAASGFNSTFDSSTEDWRIHNDGSDPVHIAAGGNPGGYIESTDRGRGVTWYWMTPAAWAGDRSEFAGGSMRFDLKQSAATSQFDNVDVIISSGDLQYGYELRNNPAEEWTSYEVPLVGRGWTVIESEAAASDDDIARALAALDAIMIRGEYRTGPDTGGLDNVSLSTEPADIPANDVTEDALPDLPDLAQVARGAAILELSSEWDDQEWTAINLLDGNPDVGWSSTEQGGTVVIGLAHDMVEAIAIDTRSAQDATYPGISAQEILVERAVDPTTYPDLAWESVGTISISPNSLGLLDTPGLQTPFLRFTITKGGTAEFAEIMEIMVYGTLQDRQISLEMAQLADALAAAPVGATLFGEQWNFAAVEGVVVGCSAGGASTTLSPNEGGLAGDVTWADGSTSPAIMSVLTNQATMILDPAGSPVRAQSQVNPEGTGCTPGEPVDDEVIEAQITPDDQREADPLIIIAAARGDVAEVQAQLAAGVNPNVAQASKGWTALLFAAQDGHTEVANVLIDAGADIDRGSDDGWTPLMIASQNGHADTVETLLTAGANPRVGRSSNWTALHSAALRNRPGIVTQLIAAGAPLEAAEDGFTPLTIAAQEGDDAVIDLLIAAGARVDGNPAVGPTPLYMTVQNNNITSAQLLLVAGADPGNGGTSDPPMVTVGSRDRIELASILVDAGANIDQQRGDGFTALHWAAYRDNAALAQLLVDLGADTSVTDDDGNTPLDIAIRRDSDAAAAVLR